jgi:hypothetical protein
MLAALASRVIDSQRASRAQVIPFTVETTAPLPGQPIKRQWEFIQSTATAIKLLCPRRVGKTVGVVKRVCAKSWEQPGRRTLYINHTLGNAKKQFFDPPGEAAPLGLLGTLDSHGIGYTADRTNVSAELENGSYVQGVGCDKISEVRKKLGFYWHEIIIDEIQEYAEDLLDLLVRRALAPTMIQTRGTLILSGTQPEIHAGFWWDTINNAEYELFTWQMLDNPKITKQAIFNEMKKAGFTVNFDEPEKNHPIVQREVFCIAAIDPNVLMYEYEAGRDGATGRNEWPAGGVPDVDKPEVWRYAMGVDIGGVNPGNDSDGIVIWGWMVDDPTQSLYERASYRWGENTKDRLDIMEFCNRVLELHAAWSPMVAGCIDTGGAGAVKAISWIAKRMKGLKLSPKPTSVDLSQRAFNDELRSGRARINPSGPLATALKVARKGRHEPDVAAAGRYGHHCVYNYLSKERKKPETDQNEIDRLALLRRKQAQNEWLTGQRSSFRH